VNKEGNHKMKYIDRPTQITTILKDIFSGVDAEISAELETYIADLEARQPIRPVRIAATMSIIRSQYPDETGISLEAYISGLEARQQAVLPGNGFTPSWDPQNPPVWSQQRSTERKQHRQKRALQKQNNYR
jgi:hypothetical protein